MALHCGVTAKRNTSPSTPSTPTTKDFTLRKCKYDCNHDHLIIIWFGGSGSEKGRGNTAQSALVPRGLGEFAVDLLVRVHVESPLHKGEGHLQGFHSELRAMLGDELQSLDAHQPAVAGGVLLQILATA